MVSLLFPLIFFFCSPLSTRNKDSMPGCQRGVHSDGLWPTANKRWLRQTSTASNKTSGTSMSRVGETNTSSTRGWVSTNKRAEHGCLSVREVKAGDAGPTPTAHVYVFTTFLPSFHGSVTLVPTMRRRMAIVFLFRCFFFFLTKATT